MRLWGMFSFALWLLQARCFIVSTKDFDVLQHVHESRLGGVQAAKDLIRQFISIPYYVPSDFNRQAGQAREAHGSRKWRPITTRKGWEICRSKQVFDVVLSSLEPGKWIVWFNTRSARILSTPRFLRLTVVELPRFRGGHLIAALPLDKLCFDLTETFIVSPS